MASSVCSNCKTENEGDARFCKKCGTRLVEASIDADLERRLHESIEAKLHSKWIAREAVEKDMALNAATQLAAWAKLFAYALGIPAAIALGILTFFGIKSTTDLAAVQAQATALRKTALELEEQYQNLQKDLPRLNAIANELRTLEGRVRALEQLPCWADSSGMVQILLFIELRSDVAIVKAAWPDYRDASARKIDGVNELLSGPISYHTLEEASRKIRDQSSECRHYVRLKNAVNDPVAADRARLMINRYFYFIEAPR